MNPKSPLTGTGNTTLVERFDVATIIENYKCELGLDVTAVLSSRESVALYRCNETGYRFFHPFDVAGAPQFYESLAQRQDYYPSHLKWENSWALSRMKPGSSVLDVGSGAGAFVERCAASGFLAEGLEPGRAASEAARRRGLTSHETDLRAFARTHEAKFDAVTMFQVLEHVCDPLAFAEAAFSTVKPGGGLIVGVPNNNPYLYRVDRYHTLNTPPHHVGLWDAPSLSALGRILGSQSVEVEVGPLEEFNDYVNAHLRALFPNSLHRGRLMAIMTRQLARVLRRSRLRIPGRWLVGRFLK